MKNMIEEMGLTEEVARFVVGVRPDQIPNEVQSLGRKSILDGLAAAISGTGSHAVDLLESFSASAFGSGQSAVIGRGRPLSPAAAALVNGTAMHADDYDDTMQAMTGKFQGIHPTAPVFCALLAASTGSRHSGADFLAAYQAGVEVACKLFDATSVDHILDGFHSTGTCGLIGATVAVANLRKMSLAEVQTAIGIAASQACGLQENFGTMTKPFHAGRSAQGGLISAELSGRGFTASQQILEAPRGFFSALGGGYMPEHIRGRLGAPWSFVERGIWLKPWPTGSLGHPATTLMEQLVSHHDIQAENVREVRLKTSENIHETLLHHHPKTELEAKFSLEFCLASILVNRKLGLREFTDAYVARDDIQRGIGLIRYSTFSHQAAQEAGYTIVTSFIEIETIDGQVHKGRLDYGKGSKANPMSLAEVEDKFRDCAGFTGWSPKRAERVIGLVHRLDELENVAELAEALSGEA